MYPTLGDLLGVDLPVETHGFFVLLGVLAAGLVFVHEARRRGQTDERILYVVMGALVGGAVFMRLGTWLQHVDLRAERDAWPSSGSTATARILGGLVGAWLGVHVAKRLTGYRLRTGDLFAPAVALGMAVGRIGCLLTEQPGTPDRRRLGDHPRRGGRGPHRLAGRRPAAPVVRLRDRLPPRSRSRRSGGGCAAAACRRARSSSGTSRRTASSASWSSSCAATTSSWAGLTRPQLFLLVTVPLVARAHRLAGPARRLS